MKSLVAFGVGVALLLSAAAATSQEPTARTPGARKAAAQSMGTVVQMDEQIKKMQALHERMIGATTADERQKAGEEARKETQAAMALLQPGTRGAGVDVEAVPPEVMDAALKGKHGGRGREQIVGKRLELMQMVIQLLVDQQALMSVPKDSGAPKKK